MNIEPTKKRKATDVEQISHKGSFKKQQVEHKLEGTPAAKKAISQQEGKEKDKRPKTKSLEKRSMETKSTIAGTPKTVLPEEIASDIFGIVAKNLFGKDKESLEALKALRATSKLSEALTNEYIAIRTNPNELYGPELPGLSLWQQLTDLATQMFGDEAVERTALKADFAQEKKLPIRITVKDGDEAEQLMKFLNDPYNNELAKQIDQIDFGSFENSFTWDDIEKKQELLRECP